MAPIKTEQYEWQGWIKKCAKAVFLTLAFGLAVGGATAAQASGKSFFEACSWRVLLISDGPLPSRSF